MVSRLQHHRAAPTAGLVLLVLLPLTAHAHTTNLRQRYGNYNVDLCVPTEGMTAGEAVEMFVRVTDAQSATARTDGPGVSCTQLQSRITMPLMPGMPPIVPKVRSLGYAGFYSLPARFPHGGDYQVALTITPVYAKPFTLHYAVQARDETPAGITPRPFTLELKTLPTHPMANQPVQLELIVRSQETGKIVTDYETIHEKKLHLILVRDDLSLFFHEHPILHPDGRFTYTFTFPSGGNWRLFAEIAPRGEGEQTVMTTLDVGGLYAAKAELSPPPAVAVSQEGMTLAMQPVRLVARQTLALQFTLRDEQGHPITDLQPWLGAQAHLTLIEQDAATFIHSHPDERDAQNSRQGTLLFLARFPKPGLYRGWVQFMRGGAVHTLSFTIRVMDT